MPSMGRVLGPKITQIYNATWTDNTGIIYMINAIKCLFLGQRHLTKILNLTITYVM